MHVSADNDVLIFTVACFWPFLQAANAVKLLPKAEAKHPSIKSVNMTNSQHVLTCSFDYEQCTGM